jgi:hypothetical protein
VDPIGEVKATCAQVAEGLPLGVVRAARDQTSNALAVLTGEFNGSTNPHYQAAVGGLRALLAELDSAAAALATGVEHARRYRAQI